MAGDGVRGGPPALGEFSSRDPRTLALAPVLVLNAPSAGSLPGRRWSVVGEERLRAGGGGQMVWGGDLGRTQEVRGSEGGFGGQRSIWREQGGESGSRDLLRNWVTCSLTCPREAQGSGWEPHIAAPISALAPSLSELTLSSCQPLVRTLVLRHLEQTQLPPLHAGWEQSLERSHLKRLKICGVLCLKWHEIDESSWKDFCFKVKTEHVGYLKRKM